MGKNAEGWEFNFSIKELVYQFILWKTQLLTKRKRGFLNSF